MALTTLVSADVAAGTAFRFGGPSGKKRKIVTVVLNDPAATSGGMTIGAVAGDILASVLGFEKIEWCSNLNIYTTSTGVTVRIYAAVPNLAGTSILLSDSGQTAGAIADATIATSESASITLIGY